MSTARKAALPFERDPHGASAWLKVRYSRISASDYPKIMTMRNLAREHRACTDRGPSIDIEPSQPN